MSTIKESIFSHAVALHQGGRLKSTIYASGKEIFILNQDKTILLLFTLPAKEKEIKGQVSFIANDYESNDFQEEDGKIKFVTHEGQYTKIKSCKAPEKTFSDIQDLYERYLNSDGHESMIVFNKSIISLLDESLSHMEILFENKSSVVIQRDIYTGSIIRIDKEDSGFGLAATDNIQSDFKPIGIRTNDFIALFSFCDNITFYFGDEPFVFIEGDRFEMQGVVSLCMYDELGILTESKGEINGREIEKIRGSEQETDQATGKGPEKKKGQKNRRRKC